MCGAQPFSRVGRKVRFQQGWCDFHMGFSTGFTCKNGNFDGIIWEYDSKPLFFWVPCLQTDPYNPSIILLFSSIFLFNRPKFRHFGRGSLSRFVPVGTAHQRPACLAGMVSCLVPIPILYYCLGHLLTGGFARPHRYCAPGWITPRPLTFGPLGVFLQRPLWGKAFLGDGV